MTQQPGSEPAKYELIAADLRARIERGEWEVGGRLPAKPDLRAEYRYPSGKMPAVGTIDSALRLLRDLGMVRMRQGSGIFVRSLQAAEEPEPATVRKLASQLEDVLQRLGKVEARLSAAEGALGTDGP